jgi:superfamily II RNA helicase
LRTGALTLSDPALLAGMIASFVQEKEIDENAAPLHRHGELMDACLALQETLRPFARQMIDGGFAVRPLMIQPAATVYAWARGEDWSDVQRRSGMAEGDLVMLILRTADNLRHIRALSDPFPETAAAAGQAVDLLMREPVATDWGI